MRLTTLTFGMTALALACSLVLIPCGRAAPEGKSPEDVLRAVRAKYLAAKTYRDEGIVKIDFKTKTPHFSDRPFSMAFERGGRFLWTFHEAGPPGRPPQRRYVVWSNDQVAFKSRWDIDRELREHDSFDHAMAGPTGVSGGSANAVIPLLRGAGMPPYWPEKPVHAGTEQVDGVECQVLKGESTHGAKVSMWIDGEFAIRKVFEIQEIDPADLPPPPEGPNLKDKFIVETTIEMRPVFDQPIADEAFKFEVPEGK